MSARGRRTVAVLAIAILVASVGTGATPPASPSVSPSTAVAGTSSANPGPWLAYQTWDGAVHLGLVRSDGSDNHHLVDGSHPDWSPDGQTIAYQVDDKDIWTIGVDGSNPRKVFDCEDPCVIGDSAAWSPDGHWLAFLTADQVNGTAPTGEILAVNVDTGEQRTLVTTIGPDYPAYPRWSPDGTSIVYTVQSFATTAVDDCVAIGTAITVASLDDPPQTPRTLTDPPMYADYPDWSPDGATILFNTRDQGRRDIGCMVDPALPSDLYTIHPDGSGLRQLTHNAQGTTLVRNDTASGPLSVHPSWTPDGASIVYVQTDGPTWPGWQVWTMDADGGNAAPFLIHGVPLVATHPRFQPVPLDAGTQP